MNAPSAMKTTPSAATPLATKDCRDRARGGRRTDETNNRARREGTDRREDARSIPTETLTGGTYASPK
jgi:hypothetical protein